VERYSEEPNFERILGGLRRGGVWVVLCVVVAAGVAFGFSKHQPRKYAASALLLFSNDQLSQQIAGVPTSVGGEAQPGSDERLVRIGDMAERTASTLGRGLTAATVGNSVSVAQQGETNLVGESTVIEVSASYGEPILAADIANTYAEKFVTEQQLANKRYFTAARRIVDRQLANLSASARAGTTGEALQSRAQSLRLLAGLQYNGVQLAQRAAVPTSPSSPRTSRNTLIGAVLGLLVGLGLVLLLERVDRRIRNPRDLEEVYRAPLLGSVPDRPALSQPAHYSHADGVPPPIEAETFGLILAHLRSFHADRHIRSVLITSAAPGYGKTTIALHLAEAAARAGSRTLLLEMDFRAPVLASRLGVASDPGLVEVLNGTLTMDRAIQSIDLRVPTDDESDTATLDILICGEERSSTPAKLIQSAAMGLVWDQAQTEYDLIVVDTSALTTVSDAFAILHKVDGVIAVDWIGHDPREVAEQLQNVLERSAVPLLGVIANRRAKNAPRSSDTDTQTAIPTTDHPEHETLAN
jgi:capsular exopolysaccharide synthesis family protein